MARLESTFTEGMSFENMGLWHIDHIIPDSQYMYKSVYDTGFQKSWALDNLQALWAEDNMIKGSKMPYKKRLILKDEDQD